MSVARKQTNVHQQPLNALDELFKKVEALADQLSLPAPFKRPRGRHSMEYPGGDLHDQAREVLAQIQGLNDPPTLFHRDGEIVRLESWRGRTRIRDLKTDALRQAIMGTIKFFKLVPVDEGEVEEFSVDLQRDLVKHIAAVPEPPLPRLDAIIRSPIYTPDGQMVAQDGYCPELYSQVDLGGLSLTDVPEMPTKQQCADAVAAFLDLLHDFPFADDDSSSRAHTLALPLTVLVRRIIDGPVPFFLVTAPIEGTGKSLLGEVEGRVLLGREPVTTPEAADDEEFRKRITSLLIQAPPLVVIDNVNSKLDSGSFASAITRQEWSDRRLGGNEMVTLDNHSVFVVTANNPNMSGEIARRAAWIHLDAKMEDPHTRNNFKYPNLRDHVSQNREKYLRDLLIIVNYWLSQGRPEGSKTLGSFEEWSRIVGGILENAGLDGFLANQDKLRAFANPEKAARQTFVQQWWAHMKGTEVGASELYDVAKLVDGFEGVLGGGTEHSQKIRLGQALSTMKGQVIAGFRVEYGGTKRSSAKKYSLDPTSRADTSVERLDEGLRQSFEGYKGADTVDDLELDLALGEDEFDGFSNGVGADMDFGVDDGEYEDPM